MHLYSALILFQGCPTTTTIAANGRRKRKAGNINKTLYLHLKQQMQHKNARNKIVREKRSALKGSTKDTMVYNTIRVFDTDFDVSS